MSRLSKNSKSYKTAAILFSISGVIFIVVGIVSIVTGGTPSFLPIGIALVILIVVIIAYSIMRGLVTFNQEVGPLIINAVFAVDFLALYPWRVIKR